MGVMFLCIGECLERNVFQDLKALPKGGSLREVPKNFGMHDSKGSLLCNEILFFLGRNCMEGIMPGGRSTFLVGRAFHPSMKPSCQIFAHSAIMCK